MFPRSAVSRVMTGLATASGFAFGGAMLGGCDGRSVVFGPNGTEAEKIVGLWWLLLAAAVVALVVLTGVPLLSVLRRRAMMRANGSSVDGANDRRSGRWIVIGGIALPAAILFGVFAITLGTLAAITPGQREPDLVVEIVGAQWWWEIRYFPDDPDQGVTLANELHLPVGRTVELRLGTRDVIHSFGLPGLQGRADMIPGRTQRVLVRPREAAVLRGRCVEFCGLQHTGMALTVVAEPEDDFEQWLEGQRRGVAIPPPTSLVPGATAGRATTAPPVPVTDPSSNPSAGEGAVAQTAGGSDPGGPQVVEGTASELPVNPADVSRTLSAGPADIPTSESIALGYSTFFDAGCAECHSLRGTPAAGSEGPDLTHLASRLTLAGGLLENTRTHLAAWLSSPQQIKPGSSMPGVELGAVEFLALLDFLQSLD